MTQQDAANRHIQVIGMPSFPVVLVACLIAILAMWWPMVADPFFRHDDFPAFFGEGDRFWPKTLNEGRWVNYLWHERGIMTPAWFNYAFYQLGWALFATATALVTTRHSAEIWPKVLLALMISVAPSAMTLSLWPNASTPGIWLIAIYAVLACLVSERALRALLVVFVPLTFMAYTTHPLALLIICLLRTEHRSFKDLFLLLAWFTGLFVFAVLMTYSLNLFFHGYFGIPPADWRDGTPAEDLAGLIANIPQLTGSFEMTAKRFSFSVMPLGASQLVLLVWATLLLVRHAPMELLYLVAALVTGLTLVAAQALKLGLIVPPRAQLFVWIICAIAILRGAQLQVGRSPLVGKAMLVPIVALPAIYVFVCQMLVPVYAHWQAETRLIAERLADVPDPIFILDDITIAPIAVEANIQANTALGDRLRQLTGREPVVCFVPGTDCSLTATPLRVLEENGIWRISVLDGDAGTVVEFLMPDPA